MTTSNDPDVIRAQIQATRAGLSHDVNELGEKVSPAQIAKRQRDKVVGGVMGVKDHIMGSTGDAKDSTGRVMSGVGDAVSGAPGKMASQAKGSPIAAGLIAFGVGMLLAAIAPASQPEAKAAAALKEQAQPLIEQVTGSAKQVAGNLQEPAQQALESVKSTATDAVDTVKEEGNSAVSDVKDQAQDAKDTVQQQASDS
jgi:gas vesicle protein